MRSSPVASTSVRSATAGSVSTVNVGPVSPPQAAIRDAVARRIAPARTRRRSGITKKLGICALNGRCSVVLGFGAATFDHAVLREPALGVNRRHTARSRCRDGLPVHVVLGISTRKDARDAGVGRVALRFDVTLRIHLQPSLEHLRVGLMTDCNKERLNRELRVLACLHVANDHAVYLIASEHLNDLRVPDELDLFVGEGTLLPNLGRTKLLPPAYHIHFSAEPGQEECLFHRRISAADEDDLFIAEESEIV